MTSRKKRADSPSKARFRWAILPAALTVGGVTAFLLFRQAPLIPDPDTSSMEPQVAARIQEVRRAVEEKPRAADRWGKLAMVFQAHELYREAEKSYAAARALAPKDFRWPYLQAQCLKELHEPDLALESAQAAGALKTSYVPLHLLQAFLHEQSNRSAEARSSYEEALSLEPSSAAAELGLGRLKLAAGQVDDSLSHLERAAKLAPQSGAVQAILAQAYSRAGSQEKSLSASKLARALHPDVPVEDPLLALVQEEAVSIIGYQQRAVEAELHGDPQRAEALLRLMLELQPEEPDRHYNLANNLSRQGRHEEAESRYRKALSLDPNYVPALIHLGILLSGRGDWVQAEMLFERALAVEPENPGALASLAKLQAARGDFEKSRASFQKAVAADPERAETHYDLAQALLRARRTAEAIRALEHALDLAPDRADIHSSAAAAYAQAGQFDAAWRHVHRARELGLEPPAELVTRLRRVSFEPPHP